LVHDIPAIAATLEQHPDIGLVVFDPLTEFMGHKIDSNSPTATRAVLGPLMDLLDQRDVAAIGVSHLPKAKSGAVQTAAIRSGSFSAAPRSGLLMVDEEEELPDGDGNPSGERILTGRKLLSVYKGNLVKPEYKRTLALRIESDTLDLPNGDEVEVAQV